MFFFQLRKKLLRVLRKEFNYYKVLFKARQVKAANKIMFADVSDIALNRYLYSFLKFFHISGYTVYLPKDRQIISVLSRNRGEFQYASWLLKEGFVKFGKPEKAKTRIWLEAEQLSNDYFSDFFGHRNHGKKFHLPICEYPYFYHSGCWDVELDRNKPRKRSVFMIGNCNRELYQEIGNSKIFHLPARAETVEFLYEKDYHKKVNSFEELEKFLGNNEDFRAILIDTSRKFQIGGNQLKETLASFNYYLALPGIEVPYSHNLAEAMSVSCIPILHRNYASIMCPKLEDGTNCFVYGDLNDLNRLIERLFLLESSEVEKMKNKALEYYNEHLSPLAVVEKIEKNNFDKIFIQAEVISLSYLNKNRKN